MRYTFCAIHSLNLVISDAVRQVIDMQHGSKQFELFFVGASEILNS